MPARGQEYFQTVGVPNPGGTGNPGGAYNQPGPVFRGGQHPSLGRYAPPMLGNAADPNSWVNSPGPYTFNLPNAYGPNYGYGSPMPDYFDQLNQLRQQVLQQGGPGAPGGWNPNYRPDNRFNQGTPPSPAEQQRLAEEAAAAYAAGAGANLDPNWGRGPSGGGLAVGQAGAMAGNPRVGSGSKPVLGGPVFGGGGMTKPIYNSPQAGQEVVEQPVRYDPVSRPGMIFGSPTGAPRAAYNGPMVSPGMAGPRFQR